MKIKVQFDKYDNRLSLRNKTGRVLWRFTSFFLFRPFPYRLFNSWRVFLLRIFGAKIGSNCSIACSVKVWAPWNLLMEDNSLLGSKVNCYNPGRIIIRTQTIISEGTFLCAASHDIHSSSHSLQTEPIIIEDQVWIAVESFIGMGVTIKQGAVIGARSAVFKDVPEWSVVGGNPAKVIKKRIIND